jgi:hypothetical protein
VFGGQTAWRVAAVVLVGALGLAAYGGFTANGDRDEVPVSIGLSPAHHLELLLQDAVVVRLRPRAAGSVSVRPRLRLATGGRIVLGPAKTVSLDAKRWQRVTLPLGDAGRRALSRCRGTGVTVTVRDSRHAHPRSKTRRVILDPPACARFFSSRTYWNTPLRAGAPLDPNSDLVTAQLQRQVKKGLQSNRPPTINTVRSAPPVVVVGSDQPRVRVHLDRPPDYAPHLAKAFASVPLPPWARPSPGTDSELIVWQPATDTLWEFWLLRRARDGWHARWGGRLKNVSTGPALFRESHEAWGESASGLPLAGGMITPRELRRGKIDHALGLGLPLARHNWFARPASRTDGDSRCPHAVPEGARFRLDPDLDIDKLGLPRPVAAIARAAQRYGIIVRDQSGAVVFYAQNANSFKANPYPALFEGRTGQQLAARFPWSELELVRMELDRERPEPLPTPGGLLGTCL